MESGASEDVIARRLTAESGTPETDPRLFQVVANSTDDLFIPYTNSWRVVAQPIHPPSRVCRRCLGWTQLT
jgi:hypothetical protein